MNASNGLGHECMYLDVSVCMCRMNLDVCAQVRRIDLEMSAFVRLSDYLEVSACMCRMNLGWSA